MDTDPQILRQVLRYEPETGKLFWLLRHREMFACEADSKKWNARFADCEALTADNGTGYRTGLIFNTKVRAHRVIWAMQTGAWPVVYIDHINGDRADNRWGNLREADASENSRNARLRSDNQSGFRGVTRFGGKWRAEIRLYGKATYLGQFDTPEQAAAAYAEASRRLHGEFGRVA
jgi:hypothetical protein